MFLLDSIRRRINPTSSVLDLVQTEQQAAERRTEVRRRSDQVGVRLLYVFVVLISVTTVYQSWLIQKTNKALASSSLQIQRLESKVHVLNSLVDSATRQNSETLNSVQGRLGELNESVFATSWLKEKSRSVLELMAFWDNRTVSYNTSAAYIGEGYFLTVQHGVYNGTPETGLILSQERYLYHQGKRIPARVHKRGNRYKIGKGLTIDDWVVLKVDHLINIPALSLSANTRLEPGRAIARFGNDFGYGILFDTGYLGHRINRGLYTALITTHTGISGGAVVNTDGELIGISVAKANDGDNFSYIQRLTPEMFRDIPHLKDRFTH